jgi:AdoMet-dependent rRNA methyltransferase SPB1
MWVFQQLFQKVHSTKPQASRAESAEIFVVCKGYLAPDKIDPKLLDPKYVFGEIEVDKNKKTLSFHQLEHSKKKAAEGYTLDNPMVYKDCSAAEFVLSDNHMVLLGSARSLKFDKESEVFERHPSTSDEVKECCKDVQVLGKRELRLLLSWRRKMRDFMKSVGGDSDNDDSHCDKPGEHSLQETDMDVVDKQVEVLRSEEEAALKRKRKNLRKKIFKTKEKLALRLQATEDNPGCERDQELFKLANITSQQHLSELHKGNMREDQDSLGSESPDSEDEMNGTESESILSEDDLLLTRDGKLMQINQDNGTFDSSERDDGDGDGDSDGGVNGDVDSDVGVNDLVLEKTESNPLIVQFPEEKEAASKARQTSSWFSKDVFAGVENEDDEDLELDAMLEPGSHQSKGRRTVTTDQESEPCVEISNPIAGDETAVDPSGMCTDDGDSDDEDSDYEDLKPSRERTMEGDGVEVVPVGKKRVRKLDPQGLALGALLVSSKKAREEVIDSSYNRWTHGDEDLPDWFEEDEKFHCQKQLPVTKEMVMQYQKRLKEINARPIKKIAEAKARKKAKLLKRLERARKKAESISDAVDVSEREKAQQLKMLYKKAGVMNKKKDVQYVVAKKGTGKRVPRPAGVSGPYKVVDPRMKKDRRKKPRNSKKGSNFRSRKG